MEIERAKAISKVAQTVLDSAKVELKAIELTGSASASEFLELEKGETDRFLPERIRPRRGLSTGKHLGAA